MHKSRYMKACWALEVPFFYSVRPAKRSEMIESEYIVKYTFIGIIMLNQISCDNKKLCS